MSTRKRAAKVRYVKTTGTAQSNINFWVGIGSAVLSTIIGGTVILMITSARDTSRKQTDVILDTKESVTVIKSEIPHLKEGIDAASGQAKAANEELKNQRATMVTRTELDNKHAALKDDNKNTQQAVHDLAGKIDKVQEELWQNYRGAPAAARTPP